MNELTTLQSHGNVSDQKLGEKLRELGPWFHNLHLPGGTQTAPDHPLGDFPAFKWALIAPHLPDDLTGWRVLDIGCNAGFYSFELAKRGADVLAVDHDPHYLRQLEWARERQGLSERVESRQLEVLELDTLDEQFDLVLFLGVFYHLRYPLLGLDLAAARVRNGGLFVMQSLALRDDTPAPDTHGKNLQQLGEASAPGWPRMAFVEHEFAGDPTNWWIPDNNACEAMLRSTGLTVRERLEIGTYVCDKTGTTPGVPGEAVAAAQRRASD